MSLSILKERVGCLGFLHGFILLVNSKPKSGNRHSGKEETMCQGGKMEGIDLGVIR